jgi:hypothetical protein
MECTGALKAHIRGSNATEIQASQEGPSYLQSFLQLFDDLLCRVIHSDHHVSPDTSNLLRFSHFVRGKRELFMGLQTLLTRMLYEDESLVESCVTIPSYWQQYERVQCLMIYFNQHFLQLICDGLTVEFDPGCEAMIYTVDGVPSSRFVFLSPPSVF